MVLISNNFISIDQEVEGPEQLFEILQKKKRTKGSAASSGMNDKSVDSGNSGTGNVATSRHQNSSQIPEVSMLRPAILDDFIEQDPAKPVKERRGNAQTRGQSNGRYNRGRGTGYQSNRGQDVDNFDRGRSTGYRSNRGQDGDYVNRGRNTDSFNRGQGDSLDRGRNNGYRSNRGQEGDSLDRGRNNGYRSNRGQEGDSLDRGRNNGYRSNRGQGDSLDRGQNGDNEAPAYENQRGRGGRRFQRREGEQPDKRYDDQEHPQNGSYQRTGYRNRGERTQYNNRGRSRQQEHATDERMTNNINATDPSNDGFIEGVDDKDNRAQRNRNFNNRFRGGHSGRRGGSEFSGRKFDRHSGMATSHIKAADASHGRSDFDWREEMSPTKEENYLDYQLADNNSEAVDRYNNINQVSSRVKEINLNRDQQLGNTLEGQFDHNNTENANTVDQENSNYTSGERRGNYRGRGRGNRRFNDGRGFGRGRGGYSREHREDSNNEQGLTDQNNAETQREGRSEYRGRGGYRRGNMGEGRSSNYRQRRGGPGNNYDSSGQQRQEKNEFNFNPSDFPDFD